MSRRIVVEILGTWNGRPGLIDLLAKSCQHDYLLTDEILLNTTTNESCVIKFGKDNRNLEVVFLIANNCNYQACVKIARFAKVFLDLGGLAVHIASAGITHHKNTWLAKYSSDDVFDIYSLYVALVEAEDSFFSCGMHNFGKADVFLDAAEDVNLAIYVMNVFNYYRLTEFPLLKDGQTFQPDLESPMYQMKWTKSIADVSEEMLHNQYGYWYLSRWV